MQPPVIYRHFNDKEGLLDALAEHGFALYLPQKQQETKHDPVQALRSGWDQHVQFGLKYPELYLLMYARIGRGPSPAAELSFKALHRHIASVAAAGRLRIPVDRAVALLHSAAMGIVVSLLQSQPRERDLTLSSMARDNALSMIAITEPTPLRKSALSAAASAIQAAVRVEDGFSTSEIALLKEWLKRLAVK
ncbi:Transcriptional regulator, TetR family [Granulicella sibirica]|uniref:Transcriptional regulator, TetR family n=1 Tax=Granulicella sibirica TaxID=2479048 RepID=A0A4Q0T1Q3_9BACT|nr:Transcriptional regulator, TetR family [Granulicella sibirica]